MANRKHDIPVGKEFGSLLVIKEGPKLKHRQTSYVCRCVCGVEKTFNANNVIRGKSTNCGCLRIKAVVAGSKTHGMRNHPLYVVWVGMHQRCKRQEGYADRGIKVCKAWGSAEVFISWCLANGWVKGLLLDRKNNNGNYTPRNCRFVSHGASNRNRRDSKFWFVNGKRYESSRLAAQATGVSQNTIVRKCNNNIDGCYCKLKYGGS